MFNRLTLQSGDHTKGDGLIRLFKDSPWYVDFVALGFVILAFLWVWRFFVNEVLFAVSSIFLLVIWLFYFLKTLIFLWRG